MGMIVHFRAPKSATKTIPRIVSAPVTSITASGQTSLLAVNNTHKAAGREQHPQSCLHLGRLTSRMSPRQDGREVGTSGFSSSSTTSPGSTLWPLRQPMPVLNMTRQSTRVGGGGRCSSVCRARVF